MKISKNVTACNDVLPTVADNPVCQATALIKQAIACLAPVAKSDIVAKDSIVNLAVVLFDLQGE